MEVTNIKVQKRSGDNKLRAYAAVTFDNCFVVHNIKVIQGKDGMFIAMPNRKTKTGVYRDIAHPIQHEFREELQRRILEEYNSCTVQDDTDMEI